MSEPIALQMTLANCGTIKNANSLYDYIESKVDGIETYQINTRANIAAAIDFIIVLGAVGSIASIASLLWIAYEKYIAPKKHDKDDTAGIYIVLNKPDGTHAEFWIGNQYKNKDVFIKDFTAVAEECRKSRTSLELTESKIEFRKSNIWVRRK